MLELMATRLLRIRQVEKSNSSFGRLESFTKQYLVFTCLQYKSFENTVGKGEIAHNEQFLLFPRCFLPVWRTFLPFSLNLKLSSATSPDLEKFNICRLAAYNKNIVAVSGCERKQISQVSFFLITLYNL